MEMKWYTAYTKPNLEKKVTAILNRKKIIQKKCTGCPTKCWVNSYGASLFGTFLLLNQIQRSWCQIKAYAILRYSALSKFFVEVGKNFLWGYIVTMCNFVPP